MLSFPFGQHKHIGKLRIKLLPRPTTFQTKQGQHTSQAIKAMSGLFLSHQRTEKAHHLLRNGLFLLYRRLGRERFEFFP